MCTLVTFHTTSSMRKMVRCHSLFYHVLTFLHELISISKLVLVPAEHFNPLLDQISKLEEALYNIQFEQHWLEAQTDRQAIGNVYEHVSNLNNFHGINL